MDENFMPSVFDVKEDTNTAVSNEAQRFAGLIRQRPLSDTDKEYLIDQLRTLNQAGTSDYILATLFPEYHDAVRFPMMFPNPTAVFKHHEYFDCTPGSDGKILIQLLPTQTWSEVYSSGLKHDDHYLRMYTKFDSATNKFNSTDMLKVHDTIGDFYESVVLRGAVIRAFYIGTDEKMSGFLQGSIDYFAKTNLDSYIPTIDDVEDGYYKQFAKPNEGIRVVWFPKDYNDYNFNEPGITRNGTNLYIYGSGLDPDQTIRVDVIRHFEGFPKTHVRDYIEVKRPSSTAAQSAMETMGAVHVKAPELLMVKPKDAGYVSRNLRKKGGAFERFLKDFRDIGQTVAQIAGAAAPFLL